MKLIIAKRKTLLIFITLIPIFGSGAIAETQQFIFSEPKPEKKSLFVNLKKCRLNAYSIGFDVMHDRIKVGFAKRELLLSEGVTTLSSNLKASYAFFTFTQTEQSKLSTYPTNGFASAHYLKTRKKPFHKQSRTEYSIVQKEPFSRIRPEVIYDPLSVYDHLRELVCSGLKEDVSLNVQTDTDVDLYHFTYKGLHKLNLPTGDVKAVLMVRTRNTSTRETSVWFDINTYYLPVKIQQTKDGDTQAAIVATALDVN
jgi:hypothetical protein